jgi:(E)-4-hydroxy-3-methylbut-2-enyl-diphosphate synthase
VYVDGRLTLTLRGDRIVPRFIDILNDYVASHYAQPAELGAAAPDAAAPVLL